MRSTRISIVAVGLAAALALAGCGRSGGDENSAGGGEPIGSGPATGDISLWAMGTEGELLPEFIEEFEAQNPGVTVTVTAIPWADYAKKIETAIASGQTPDVTMVGSTEFANFASTGGFDPVPDGLVDPAVFYSAAAEGVEYGGTAYGVPWYVDVRALFYRKDLAAAAGVEAPTTWDEAVPFYRALQEQGAEWGVMMSTGGPLSWQDVLPYLWQAGAELTDEGQTEYRFDTPEALEGLEHYRSLIDAGVMNPIGPSQFGDTETRFVEGSVGAYPSGPFGITVLKQAVGEEFVEQSVGVATLPAGPESDASFVAGAHLAVFDGAANRDGAWKLVRWLSDPEIQGDWFEISGDLPAVESTWDEGVLASDEIFATFRAQIRTSKAPPLLTTWSQVGAAVDVAIEKVAAGTASPAAALAEHQAAATRIGTGD